MSERGLRGVTLRIPTDPMSRVLGEVLERLAAVDEHHTYRMGIPEAGWYRFSELDEEVLGAWFEQVLGQRGDRRAAAHEVGGGIGYLAVLAWMLPTVVGRRLPLQGLDQVAVHLGEDYPDGVAYGPGQVAVLPTDPAAGRPGVAVAASWSEMLDQLVDRLAAIDHVFDRVRQVVRIGEPALWGEVADMVGALSLWAARELDTDRDVAWADTEVIIDRLAARRERLKARPTPFPITYSGGTELYQVRGTCCLYYRTCDDPDPAGEGYCATCPFRTDESRAMRIRRNLEARSGR